MRLLTAYELELVAGGVGSTDDSQLNGNDNYDGSWYGAGNSGGGGNPNNTSNGGQWMWFAPASYFGDLPPGGNGTWQWVSGSGTSGGGGGFGDMGQTLGSMPTVHAKPTPCVSSAPAGSNLADINDAALAASNLIAGLNDEQYEYSSILYSLNGTVGFTQPHTDSGPNQTTNVNFLGGLSGVPAGAVIVGILHNHPDQPNQADGFPSPAGMGYNGSDDWTAYDQVINWNANHPANQLPRGITVDPNLLAYVYTNEDLKTRVYDVGDRNTMTPSCSLQ